jgi:hypothetical protein
MKIRWGFVSNSSSTSFTFIYKGNFVDVLRKYNQYFDLYYENMHINVEDVIHSIMSVFPKVNTSIKCLLEDIDHRIGLYKEYSNDYYFQEEVDLTSKKYKIIKLASKGLDKCIKIDFGDNHGEIEGGIIGTVMDYEGRMISINKPDLVVFTEQNR